MKLSLLIAFIIIPFLVNSQIDQDSLIILKDNNVKYKSRVLESVEIDFLTSFFTQDGKNSAVTGGLGSEQLNDYAGNISISIPINDDDVLSIDGNISAYTSASSFNTNPFNRSGKDEESKDKFVFGSPWVQYSGASFSDVWYNGNIAYSHSSDDRNTILKSNLSYSNEYDYISIGLGGGITKQFRDKNTELNANINIFIDQWKPVYPIEIWAVSGDRHKDFFNDLDILNADGQIVDKNDKEIWQPSQKNLIENKGRNTYAFSLTFSHIINKNAQISIFSDITYQSGWLANPMQRVYFSDKSNFYIGNPLSIKEYSSSNNQDVFQLADDIERLPDNRVKLPIGSRFHYYVNEFIVIKAYYRYYFDTWGINSNTYHLEIPIKINDNFTLYPNYRYYDQTPADYFSPFDQHLSSSEFYTSDYDLSQYNSQQFGIGIKYSDIFTKSHVWKFGLKNLTLNYNYYRRNTGLQAHIVSLGSKFILDH